MVFSLGGCGLLVDNGFDPTDHVDTGVGRNDVGLVDGGGAPDLGPIECTDDDQCDDLNACNGVEFCGDDGLCASSPGLQCGENDGVVCTVAQCDPVGGCVEVPDDERCDIDEICGDAGCEPMPCDDRSDCRASDACIDEVICGDDGFCQALGPKTCLDDASDCLVTSCVLGQCVEAPDSSLCDTQDDCGRGICGSNGRCENVADDDLCPQSNIACLEPHCDEGDAGFLCEMLPLDDLCDDGEDCTEESCRPGTPGADPFTGCGYDDFNDGVCPQIDGCVQSVCGVHGCTGVRLGPCDSGSYCSLEAGACVPLPNNSSLCMNVAADPCSPRLGFSGLCQIEVENPCGSLADDCEVAYCELFGGAPQCQVRPDPLCQVTDPG